MAIDINKDISYQLSINVLKALGGNTDVPFESVEEVWDEINKIYDNAGDRLDIEALIMDIRNNGLYEFYPNENADAYAPVRVNVNVPQKYTDEYVEQLGREAFNEGKIEGEEIGYQKGFAEGSDDGYQDGYSEGLDDGAEEQKSLMVEATIRENGVFERSDGYRKVTVDVTIPTFETEQLSVELKENGDYNYTPSKDGYDSVSVSVNVPTSEPADLRILDIEVKENKSYEYLPTDYDGWNKVNLLVNVPTGGGGDSGKPKIYNGFRFDGTVTSFDNCSQLELIDFSQYDWSNVYDLTKFFANFGATSTSGWNSSSFVNFLDNYNGKMLSLSSMFMKKTGWQEPLRGMPIFGERTKDCIDMAGAFSSNRIYLVTNGCINTSSVINMASMFSTAYMSTIPLLDTSNACDMGSMFSSCSRLESIPLLDTSKCRRMSSMFSGCSKLTEIPQLNTSNVMETDNMFNGCTSLTKIPLLDFGNVNNFGSLFGSSNLSKLTDLGGFKDLGKVNYISGGTSNLFDKLPNLTHESIMNVINNLYDRTAAGFSVKTMKFGTTNLGKLTDEEKAIATNKGWTLN